MPRYALQQARGSVAAGHVNPGARARDRPGPRIEHTHGQMPSHPPDHVTDLFIIGGGINGCGIARDAAGRGLAVSLAEMGELAGTTSSASTKLFHGGLRYLECFEFRLVALNARNAADRCAEIMTRTRVTAAERAGGHRVVALRDAETTRRARILVNAAWPWVGEIIRGALRLDTADDVRLVRGSHIVTRRLFGHDKADFLQGSDGRIIVAIPCETDFTLIGTTDDEHPDVDLRPEIADAETEYLLAFASQYFKDPVTRDDIIWTYSGVRPLYDDGANSATAATRECVLNAERAGGAPLPNVFGGKITTCRRLAAAAAAA